jgi:hypothetical protein
MSYLWLRDAEGKRVAHSIQAASHDLYALLLSEASGSSACPIDDGLAARMISFRVGGAARWVVVADAATPVRVNGVPLTAVGARVLCDRDEVSIPGLGSAFYSGETLAVVEPFPGSEHPVVCGRCRQAIAAGAPVVRCPGCHVYYDQAAGLECWRASDSCTFCSQLTALDAGFAWVPED